MKFIVELDNASSESWVPDKAAFEHWSARTLETLSKHDTDTELSIRLVDEEESAMLNSTYRNKTGPTNILSFPCDQSVVYPEDQARLLGDLAICAPVVTREASEQNKTLEAHWAHLTVHGILHLGGYDHETDDDAVVMESIEKRILSSMGYDNPYE